MKQTPHSLLFALLFALVLFSIGLSAHSMLRAAGPWPAPHAGSSLRQPAVASPQLSGTLQPKPARAGGPA